MKNKTMKKHFIRSNRIVFYEMIWRRISRDACLDEFLYYCDVSESSCKFLKFVLTVFNFSHLINITVLLKKKNIINSPDRV